MNEPHQIIDGQRLSHRQGQVLLCCAYSMTMKQAAEKLFISHKTVGGHHQNIRAKYSVEGYHGLYCLGLKVLEELENWQGTNLRPEGFT